ncbi:MAG: hypothetical protein JRF56_03705 [Deltaproteobacteria bacterium]|jgi:hypothetical protein|nr:hypothetical protein [Deltaproteobacteria bacterium]
MIRPVTHILLHFLAPGSVAWIAFRGRWKSAWIIMALTIIIDLDHLLANPIYDPNRCGIGFHPLHSYPAIVIYLVMTTITKTRLIGLGLLIHMALDGLDCIWMIA